jgi:hypothetical protein
VRDLTFPDPVEDARELFDRDKPLTKIREALRSRARRSIVILGGRLIGKTSVLNVAAQWAEQDASFSVVKLSRAGSRKELAAEIYQGIRDQVDPDGRQPPELFDDDGMLKFSTTVGFIRVVRGLTDRAPASRFLLCVDEFDSLLEGCSDSETRQILDFVPHLTEGSRLPIRFLFTISQVPDRIRLAYRSPFLNQSTIVELPPWSATESREFVSWLLGDDLELDEAAQRELFGVAGGHPYFTKALLQALLDAHPSPPGRDRVAAGSVAAAAAAAARSRTVTFALSNIAEAHLPAAAIALLDKAAGSAGGLGAKDIRELRPGDGVLEQLTEGGYLDHDGAGRYSLRLGMWRYWRASRLGGGAQRARWLVARARASRRLLDTKAVRPTLLATLGSLVLVLALGTLLFLPSSNATARGCAGAAAGVRARVSYPSHVSSGDEHRLQLRVMNDAAGGAPVGGSAVVGFPRPASGEVNVTSDNALNFDRLGAGEQLTLFVTFTYAQQRRLLPDTRGGVPVELHMSANGALCGTERWSMAIAPVPHLRALGRGIEGLIALVVVPLLIQLLGDALSGSRAGGSPDPAAASSDSTVARG